MAWESFLSLRTSSSRAITASRFTSEASLRRPSRTSSGFSRTSRMSSMEMPECTTTSHRAASPCGGGSINRDEEVAARWALVGRRAVQAAIIAVLARLDDAVATEAGIQRAIRAARAVGATTVVRPVVALLADGEDTVPTDGLADAGRGVETAEGEFVRRAGGLPLGLEDRHLVDVASGHAAQLGGRGGVDGDRAFDRFVDTA